MLHFLPIGHPKNTKFSFLRLKTTIRVYAGCSVLARDSFRHVATKSSAERTSTPSSPHRDVQIRSNLFRSMLASNGAWRGSRMGFSHRAILHHCQFQTLVDLRSPHDGPEHVHRHPDHLLAAGFFNNSQNGVLSRTRIYGTATERGRNARRKLKA